MKEENMEFYTEGCNTDDVDIQLEAFDELVEDIMLEALKHMSAKEKLDAKKYRMSAKGKKAIAKHLKKAARAGYKVDKKRSRLMKKVADFRRDESVNEDIDIDNDAVCEELYNTLTVEDLADFDALVEEIVAFAEACKTDETDCEIDPETGEEMDDMDEAFKHMTATAKAKAKKYRMSAAGKKALAKYLKKRSRSGYKVDKQRSKLAKKVAMFRNEAIQESLDKQFAATPLFESLNEAESNELKGIVHNAVSSILNQSYDKIAEDVTKDYETYMTEEVMPETCRLFEEYKTEIIKNLNEEVENYLRYVAEEVVDTLENKNLIVKSQRSADLEEFSESLLALIKDKLNIIPEQEDILIKNQKAIDELNNEIQESKIDNKKLKNKLDEANRQIYVLKNIPSELSESQKEMLQNYVDDVLTESEDFLTFKNAFDKAVGEIVSINENTKTNTQNNATKKDSTSFNSNSLADALFRMGRV